MSEGRTLEQRAAQWLGGFCQDLLLGRLSGVCASVFAQSVSTAKPKY